VIVKKKKNIRECVSCVGTRRENVRTYVTASIDQIYEELGEMGYNDVLIKWAIEQAIKKHD
jgi:Leu/Phe-tRNA-protein transferase